MKTRTVFLTTGLALGLAALGFAIENASHDGLVVHEWGTFTSIAGEDGTALEWRPLTVTNDLPGFVHEFVAITNATGLRHGDCPKCDLSAKIRMETPVLYFYADHDTDVAVRVDFPKGRVTEWYPSARTVGSSIDWGRIAIMPHSSISRPTEDSSNRYYAARNTDSAFVRVCSTTGRAPEFEKFLFYRGVGFFDPPLAVKLKDNNVHVKNPGADRVAELILFECRNGQIGYRVQQGDTGETVLARPSGGNNLESLVAEMEKILVNHGLYEKEAKAMLETWRDSWFEDGLRVFYILPRNTTDTVLPITIDPQPAQLVRVLVGRIEIITPEMETTIRAEMQRLNDPSPDVRATARAALRKQGRFAEPVMKRLLDGQNEAARDTFVKGIFE